MIQNLIKFLILIVFLSILFLVGSRVIGVFSGEHRKEMLCVASDRAKKAAFTGILLKKFKDQKNHLYETIIIKTDEDTVKSTLLVLDKSGLYDDLEIRDSLIKVKGQQNFLLIRNETTRTYTLNFGCN